MIPGRLQLPLHPISWHKGKCRMAPHAPATHTASSAHLLGALMGILQLAFDVQGDRGDRGMVEDKRGRHGDSLVGTHERVSELHHRQAIETSLHERHVRCKVALPDALDRQLENPRPQIVRRGPGILALLLDDRLRQIGAGTAALYCELLCLHLWQGQRFLLLVDNTKELDGISLRISVLDLSCELQALVAHLQSLIRVLFPPSDLGSQDDTGCLLMLLVDLLEQAQGLGLRRQSLVEFAVQQIHPGQMAQGYAQKELVVGP
mmetsp:Transcript_74833/g.165533  ORF Transcript_74833/g.165533 Transcript_74833/m.165533 type:complete len:262 (+) Transcript_74833:47-832(+)